MTIKEKQQRKQLLNQKVDNLKKVIDKVLYYVCAPFIYGFYIYPHKFFRYMYKKFIVNFKINIEDRKFSTKNIKKHLEKQIIKSFINYNVKEIFIGCSSDNHYRCLLLVFHVYLMIRSLLILKSLELNF
jgi:ATP adenylyltransferase/5',5'''-P-1,P-4-tetraphosphate phosphorylase II